MKILTKHQSRRQSLKMQVSATSAVEHLINDGEAVRASQNDVVYT
jgi:hypothetical protein